MPKQRFTTEEIIHKLREPDVRSGPSLYLSAYPST